MSTFDINSALEMEQRMAQLESSLRNNSSLSSNAAVGRILIGATDKNVNLADVGEQIMDSTDSVGLALRIMDSRFSTKFYGWIRNENNAQHIALRLKKLVFQYDVPQIARMFNWLFADWSMTNIAGTLIKIFYERGLDDVLFCQVVEELCASGRPWDQTIDMISTLVIGETPQVTARFVRKVTVSWDVTAVVELLDTVSKRSKWPASYYEQFVMHYASLNPRLSDTEAIVRCHEIRLKFQDRAAAVLAVPSGNKTIHLTPRLYATKLFEQVVLDEVRNTGGRATKTSMRRPAQQYRVRIDVEGSGMSSPVDFSPTSVPTSPTKDPRSPRQCTSPM